MSNNINIFLPRRILEREKKLKKLKLKAKDFLLNLLENYIIKQSGRCLNKIFFLKNNEILFYLDLQNKNCCVNYTKIWSVLENEFQMQYIEIQKFIKDILQEQLKISEYAIYFIGKPFPGTLQKRLEISEFINHLIKYENSIIYST